MNKKIFLIVLILAAVLVISGCGGTTKTYTSTDGNTNVEVKTNDMNSDEWCVPGQSWSMTSTGTDSGSAEWVIKEKVSSGKYAGYCHIVADIESDGEQTNIEYYVDESGDNGYMVMTSNGETYEQEWHN